MAETVPQRRGPSQMLIRRWPTALALAVAALILADGVGDAADVVDALAAPILLLALEYLVVNQIGRREASWPVVGVLALATAVITLTEAVPLSTALVALALVFLIWGAITGTPNGRPTFWAQAAGMIGFGALALLALAVDPDLGRYLVAAGWLLHGIWDFIHLKLDKVVSRTYAECCGVIDTTIAALIIILPT